METKRALTDRTGPLRYGAWDAAGWLGTTLILLSYLAALYGWLPTQSATYQVTNLLGALGIICSAWPKRDYQPMLLNAIWAVAALIAMTRLAG